MTKGLWRSDKPPIGEHTIRRRSTGVPITMVVNASSLWSDGFEWLDERFIQHDGGPCPVDPDARIIFFSQHIGCETDGLPARVWPWQFLAGDYYRIVSSTERVPEAEKSGAVPPAAQQPVSVDPNVKMIERDLVEPVVKAAPAPAPRPAPDPFPVSSDDMSRQGWLLGGRFGQEE